MSPAYSLNSPAAWTRFTRGRSRWRGTSSGSAWSEAAASAGRSAKQTRRLISPPSRQLIQDERVCRPLVADARFRHVPRQHDRVIRQRQQLLHDAVHLLLVVAAGQVRAADGALEQRIAAEEHAFRVVREAAGGVAGRMEDLQLEAVDLDLVAFLREEVRLRRRLHLAPQSNRTPLPPPADVIALGGEVQPDWAAQRAKREGPSAQPPGDRCR